jgi:hypothetical protein
MIMSFPLKVPRMAKTISNLLEKTTTFRRRRLRLPLLHQRQELWRLSAYLLRHCRLLKMIVTGALLIRKAVRRRLERSEGVVVGGETEGSKCEPTSLTIYFASLMPFVEMEIQRRLTSLAPRGKGMMCK